MATLNLLLSPPLTLGPQLVDIEGQPGKQMRLGARGWGLIRVSFAPYIDSEVVAMMERLGHGIIAIRTAIAGFAG